MKQGNLRNSFQNNKFKYGGIATLTTLIIFGILVFMNLVAGKLNLTKDLTTNKMYSLSEQSEKIVTSLNKDVTIYGFYETGEENYSITTLLNEYKAKSKHIHIEYKDPMKYPQIAQKYTKEDTKVGEGTLVVESGSKFKVIDPFDLVNYDYNNPAGPTAQSLAVEQNLSSAILYVTSEKTNKLYVLQGHEENPLSTEVNKQLELENYTVEAINLTMKDAKLEEDATLLVASPKRDLSAEEEKAIRQFLEQGGKTIFLMDLIEQNLPRFQSIFNSYGVEVQKAITVEGNSQYSAQNPLYLLPKQMGHAILASLNRNDLRVLIPGCQSVKVLETKKNTVTVEPLLQTSENSWGKINLKATSSEKEEGDIAGPLTIATAITDKGSAKPGKETKIVVVSNSTFLSPQIVSYSNNANMDFFMNTVNWLQDKEEGISVRPKNIEQYILQISGFQQLLFSGIVIILIPGIVLAAGIRVWFRRRKQ